MRITRKGIYKPHPFTVIVEQGPADCHVPPGRPRVQFSAQVAEKGRTAIYTVELDRLELEGALAELCTRDIKEPR